MLLMLLVIMCYYLYAALASYFAIVGVKISVTGIRKLLESSFFEAMQDKTITYEQYCQTCVMQGHSVETAKRYYRSGPALTVTSCK